MLDASVLEEMAHHCEQLSELRKDEDLVSRIDQFGQDPVQQLEFA